MEEGKGGRTEGDGLNGKDTGGMFSRPSPHTHPLLFDLWVALCLHTGSPTPRQHPPCPSIHTLSLPLSSPFVSLLPASAAAAPARPPIGSPPAPVPPATPPSTSTVAAPSALSSPSLPPSRDPSPRKKERWTMGPSNLDPRGP